jgi:5,8-dihydroxy-2-naphthoate synthase
MKLSLAFSPCPNDCFMFDAIVNRRIDLEGIDFDVHLADVESLNYTAIAGQAQITKLSYHAYAHCVQRYVVLDAGSALGRGCGPLLISNRSISPDQVAAGDVRIAIPGKYTTANFLLALAFPAARNKTSMVFSEIEAALLRDEFDAGLIIHENRFTYEAKGLRKIVDLGEFWERETGAPIPLGGIAISRVLPDELKRTVNRIVRRSVEYAVAHPDASRSYVRRHAQEMDSDVMYRHIELYVNEYSIDLGFEGRRAVEVMFERARAAGVIPDVKASLFLAQESREAGARLRSGLPDPAARYK